MPTKERKKCLELKQSASEGDAQAQHDLAMAYYGGEGVAQNHELAVALWVKASQQGHAPSQNQLGRMLIDGLGVDEPNLVEARYWLRKAVYNKYEPAVVNLAASLKLIEDELQYWTRVHNCEDDEGSYLDKK